MRHFSWLRLLGIPQLRGRNKRKQIYKINDPYLDDWERLPYYVDQDVIIYCYQKTFIDGTKVRIYADRADFDRYVWRIDSRYGIFGQSLMITQEFTKDTKLGIKYAVDQNNQKLHFHAREY